NTRLALVFAGGMLSQIKASQLLNLPGMGVLGYIPDFSEKTSHSDQPRSYRADGPADSHN
ncbi:hypothetical protein CathTA2_0030, partial [Caldalkalibacillus thermarum TA2.A1]